MADKFKLGIIGFGVVGQALANGFKDDQILYYDKFKDTSTPFEQVIAQSDYIFICLPTPMFADESGIDLAIIDEMVEKTTKLTNQTDKIVVIKSTVVPGTTKKYQQDYPQTKFVFNPEFLTEAHYLEDFINSDRTIIGSFDYERGEKIAQLYRTRFPDVPVFVTDPTTAELAKYMSNCYLALKVGFANQMADLSNKLGIEYSEAKKLMVADRRIEDTHLDVTEERGFGGKCLAPDERIFAFNSSKLKVMRAKDISNKVVGVLGWKDGKIIKDDLMITGTRKVDNMLKFSLSKGRTVTVTPDHIMIIADKKGHLTQKEAFEVTKEDYIPVVLDGFKEPIESKYQVLIRLYKEVDLSEYSVFIEDLPKSHADTLKPHLSFHQYKSFKRKRPYCVPLSACLKTGIDIDSYRIKTGKTGNLIPAAIKVTEDFARLVGYYLSEGCVSDKRVFFSFSYKEKDLIEDVKTILKNLNIGFKIVIGLWEGKKSSCTIKVSSTILAAYFSKFGINSLDKTIPYFIFHSNQQIKDNLLGGILRGDGSIFSSKVGNYWTVNLSTTSQILAEGVDALFREKGILASIGNVKTAKTKSYAWSLDVSDRESVQKLLLLFTPRQRSKVGETGKRSIKSPAFSKVKNLALLNIKGIQNINEPSLVYSIETRNHYYLTSWGILTHNCFPKDMVSLLGRAKDLGTDLSILGAAWEYNKKVRKIHDWEEIPFATSDTKSEDSKSN